MKLLLVLCFLISIISAQILNDSIQDFMNSALRMSPRHNQVTNTNRIFKSSNDLTRPKSRISNQIPARFEDDQISGGQSSRFSRVASDSHTSILTPINFDPNASNNLFIFQYDISSLDRKIRRKRLLQAEIRIDFQMAARNRNLIVSAELLLSGKKPITGLLLTAPKSINRISNEINRKSPKIIHFSFDVLKSGFHSTNPRNNFIQENILETSSSRIEFWRPPSFHLHLTCKKPASNLSVSCSKRRLNVYAYPWLILSY